MALVMKLRHNSRKRFVVVPSFERFEPNLEIVGLLLDRCVQVGLMFLEPIFVGHIVGVQEIDCVKFNIEPGLPLERGQ